MKEVAILIEKEVLGGHKAYYICDMDGHVISQFSSYKTKKALIHNFYVKNNGEYKLNPKHVFRVDNYLKARPWLLDWSSNYKF